MKKFCLLILMITLTGCASVGTPIKNTNVSTIQRNVVAATTEKKEAGVNAQIVVKVQTEATQPSAQIKASYEGSFRATVRALLNGGHTIPNSAKDVAIDYTKGVLWAFFLGLTIFLWPVPSQDKKALLWIWEAKCFVMLVLMLFYEYHYQTDSFGYFSAAHHPMSEWKAMEIWAGSVDVVFIIRMHVLAFLDSFQAAKCTFGMIGLIGIYIFYRSAVVFLREERIMVLYALAFFPSLLFWSSILGKEPLLLFSVGVYCYGAVRYARQKSLGAVMIILLGLAAATFLRNWMGLILMVPFFALLLLTVKRKLSVVGWIMVVVMALMMAVTIGISTRAVIHKFGGSFDIVRAANLRYTGFARGGSSVAHNLPEMGSNQVKFHTIKDVILFIPQGMFTSLFRPFPFEVHNLFGFLAGLEGFFLFGLCIFAIKSTRWKDLGEPIVLWAIILIFIWAGVYAFISYNLGTDCRYRTQILPIFLMLLMYLSRKRAV